MRKITYLFFLSLCVPHKVMAKSLQEISFKEDNTIAVFLMSSTAMFCYGLVIGFALVMLIKRMRPSSRRSKYEKFQRNNENIDDASFRHVKSLGDADIERKYILLQEDYKKLMARNQEIERELAESEKLSNSGRSPTSFDAKSEPFKNVILENSFDALTVSVCFLQPTSDGRFLAHGKVDKASDALYELTYQSINPSEASFRFIDVKDNTFLAVQNEPTWILVACERSNIPSGNTTSIRTDAPGKAVLINGEWEIVQKAKITYL